MRLQYVLCPNCQHMMTSMAGIVAGEAVNCPKCRAGFAAGSGVISVAPPKLIDAAKNSLAAKRADVQLAAAQERSDQESPSTLEESADDEGDYEEQERQGRPRKKKRRKAKGGWARLGESTWLRVAVIVVWLAILVLAIKIVIDRRHRIRPPEESDKVAEKAAPKEKRPAERVETVPGEHKLMKQLAGRWRWDEAAVKPVATYYEYEFFSDGRFTVTRFVPNTTPERLNDKSHYWIINIAGDEFVVNLMSPISHVA